MGLFDNFLDPLNLRDPIRQTGGDVLNLLGSDKDDPVQSALWDAGDGDDLGRWLGTIPGDLDVIKRELVLDAQASGAERQAAIDRGFNFGEVPTRVQEIQGDLGNRLSALRGDRDNLTDARSQPARQELSEQAGLHRRSVAGEGSRQSAQRSGINEQQALGNQQIEIQSLQEQLGQEAGVEQLQTEFTAFFNDLAANRFSRELSGLGVEINEYLSERGAKIGYRELEAEARQATTDMYARFLSGLGSSTSNDPNNVNPNVYGDDAYPAYDPARP